MSSYSHCVECNRRLRNAFFCKLCDTAACCWHCYDKHRVRHAPARLAPAAPSANGRASPRAR
jgi:hypothetical protein